MDSSFHLGRSEEAVELLANGLATHPDYPPFHETLGYVLRYAGLMEESMASYRRGQELDSTLDNLISTQDQITKSLIYLGDYDAALRSHAQVKSFLEEVGRSPNEKQWFYEGVIHLYLGDQTSAVHAFGTGASLDPESVWTTFGRAYEGMALGDSSRVEVVLQELEHREVVDGERHYRLVHFATFAGHPDRALNHLQKPYKNCQNYKVNQAEELVRNSLCLPSSTNLSDEDINRVIAQLNG